MNCRRILWVSVIFAAVMSLSESAFALDVRAVLKRPGCDTGETAIELVNRLAEYYVKVRVEATASDDSPGPTQCTTSTGGNSGIMCSRSITQDVVLNPCGRTGFCGSAPVFLPGGGDGCTYLCTESCQSCHTCDNRTTANSTTHCPATCNHADLEWCTTLNGLRVTVIGQSTDGSTWGPPYSDVVCVQGTYEDGTTPVCPAADSYCTHHSAVRTACDFSKVPPPICLYE